MKLSREAIIGIAIFLTGVLFFWGINYLKQNDLLNERRTFYAIYENVDGLTADRLITINGLQVGRVTEIDFHPDGSGRLLVELELDNDFQFSKNTIAKIYSQDLLGTKAISLLVSKEGDPAISGDTLPSLLELTITEEVNKQVAPIKQKAEQLLSSIDTVMLYVRALLDEGTRNNLSMTFASVQQSFETLGNTINTVDELMTENQDEITGIMSNIESISENLKNNNEELSNVISNFSQISDSLAQANIRQTFEDLNRSIVQLNNVMTKIDQGEGSLGLLVNDPELYNNLNDASKELDLLLYDLKANPDRYVRFSIFGGNKQYEAPPEDEKK